MSCLLCCIIFTFCLLASVADAQVIIFGRTTSRAGAFVPYSIGPDRAMTIWEDIVNQKGGLMVGGTRYTVKLKTYNDGSDPDLVSILYERLVNVDNATFLFAPFASATAGPVAAKYKIPMINPFPGFGSTLRLLQNNYTFNMFFPMDEISLPCAEYFASRSAKTALVALHPFSEFFRTFINSSFQQANFSLLQPAGEVPLDPKQLPAQIKQWKSLNPDVFVGYGMDPVSTATVLLHEMFKAKFFPKAINLYVAPNDPLFRKAAAWQGVQVFASGSWHSSLNSTDSIFNDSLSFDAEFVRRHNISAAELDAAAAAAGVVFVEAIKAANSIDREAVRQALFALDVQTMFGRVSFYANGTTRGKWRCFQQQEDGSLIAVWPRDTSVALTEGIYPANPPIPSGFYKKDRALRNGLIIGGCVLLFVVVVASVAYLMLRGRYHVIFVPKGSQQEEW